MYMVKVQVNLGEVDGDGDVYSALGKVEVDVDVDHHWCAGEGKLR